MAIQSMDPMVGLTARMTVAESKDREVDTLSDQIEMELVAIHQLLELIILKLERIQWVHSHKILSINPQL